MACDCVTEMNAKLAEHNTKIIETFGFPRDGSPVFTRPKIDVEKVETRKRVGPALAVPSFCPFCGKSYDGAAPCPDWLPIAGAPRDGTSILLWSDAWALSWGQAQIGHFEGDGESGGEWVTGEGSVNDNDPDFDPDAEFDAESEPTELEDHNIGPTHWMRLPSGPRA